MSSINISELVISHNANTKSFERGEACYRMGSVQSITQRGDEIQAEVQGSEANLYRVTIGFNSDGLNAYCTCPYNYDGWCKHIVATALTCARQESSIEKRPSLAQLLDRLNHVQTQLLVQELVEEHPELIDEIDGYVNAIAAPAPTIEKQPSRQITVNTKQIKAEVRHILREAGRHLEYGYEEDPVTPEVQALIQQAVSLCENNDVYNALAMLEAITDACVQDWDEVSEYGQENEELVQELNEAWCEVILSAELAPKERTDIQINFETWQDDWCANFDFASTALQQGWDYPPLLQVLEGNITQHGMWSNSEVPYYADDLALIRLKILKRQERYQEYLHLAEAEGQTKQYLTMLGRLGRVEDAVKVAQTQMSTMEEAFALAQTLESQSAFPQALDIAQQGFSLPGKCRYDLGIWTSELAEELGNIDIAILARTNAFQANPSFADYRIIEDLAENSWVDVKAELLEILRNLSRYIGLTGEKVDIFLHENLIDDAIACVSDTSSYHDDIVHRVMSAALSTRSEWVIENSRRRAESIMNAGKAEYYHYAAEWLKKTRAGYFASNQQAEWRQYYNELLSVHYRKSKLMGLLKQKGLEC